MLCPECGEENSDQAEFCDGCGSYIEISEAERHLKEVHKLYVETQQIIRASRVAANYEEYINDQGQQSGAGSKSRDDGKRENQDEGNI